MKCLSFQQPYASMIIVGAKSVECRSRKINTPVKDLVVCASKTARFYAPVPGMVYGYAIGMIDIVDCVPFNKKHLKKAMMSKMPEEGNYAYILENPRMIVPRPVKASASFFHVDFEPEIINPDKDTYRKYMLPIAQTGDKDYIEDILYMMFDDHNDFWFGFEL